MKVTTICLAAAMSVGMAAPAMAAILDAPTGLTDIVRTDVWDFSTITKTDSFPISSSLAGAEFTQTSTGTQPGKPWDGFIYVGNGPSSYEISVPAADNVKSIVLQIVVGAVAAPGFGDITSVPELSITGGDQNVATAYSERVSRGQVDTDFGSVNQSIWLGQWEVEPTVPFVIDWSASNHSQIYEIRLDQSSDTFSEVSISPTSVPEPGTLTLASLGGLALLARRRQRRV